MITHNIRDIRSFSGTEWKENLEKWRAEPFLVYLLLGEGERGTSESATSLEFFRKQNTFLFPWGQVSNSLTLIRTSSPDSTVSPLWRRRNTSPSHKRAVSDAGHLLELKNTVLKDGVFQFFSFVRDRGISPYKGSTPFGYILPLVESVSKALRFPTKVPLRHFLISTLLQYKNHPVGWFLYW